jgi:DNA-binding CsgD family transcriptional regulator
VECLPYLMEVDPLFGPHLAMAQGVSLSYLWIEDYDAARRILQRAIDAARAASAPGLSPFPVSVLSEVDFRTGAWDAASSGGHEALELAIETGQVVHAPRLLIGVARLEAYRGQDVDCRSHVAESLTRAAEYGAMHSAQMYADEILGLLEFGRRMIPQALEHLDRVARALEAEEVGEPSLMGGAPERIEALSRSGRAAESTAALELFEGRAKTTGSAWAQGAAARCRGLLADPETFEHHFDEALRWHAGSPVAFEKARTQLSFGECLRRSKRRTEARQHIRNALQTFENLGARPWADRARAELAASGETARRRNDPSASQQLTAQELRVALAVAEGASNREAAASLFLSAKTIEFHLGSVYRKLGIRSRAELVLRFTRP